jgi:RHS repeat-associated protein
MFVPVSAPNGPACKPLRRDAHNRRVRKVVAYGGVENSSEVRNGTTDFAYQGWRVLWENFVPEAMLRAPVTGPTTYVYGNYLDEAWDMLEVLSHYYFLTGVNYSVMAVVDGHYATDIVEAYEYDPYGRHRVIEPGTDETYFTSDDTYDEMGAGGFPGSEGGTINNSIRYTGQRFDAESNLMYYKNRYYDPAAGRFIGRDPLGWSEGPNRYAYVGGMPTMAVDPVGKQTLDDGILLDLATKGGGFGSVEPGSRYADVIDPKNSWGLTPDERKLANHSGPFQLYDVRNCRKTAEAAAQRVADTTIASSLGLFNGLRNGPADAVRHCVWQCCLAANQGADYAKAWGDAHENNPSSRQHADENKMDLHNNAVGRGLHSNCQVKAEDCESECLKALKRGGLDVLPMSRWSKPR